jgi:hypothetical protein
MECDYVEERVLHIPIKKEDADRFWQYLNEQTTKGKFREDFREKLGAYRICEQGEIQIQVLAPEQQLDRIKAAMDKMVEEFLNRV